MQISERSVSSALRALFKDYPLASGAVQLRRSDATLLTVSSEGFGVADTAQARFPIYSIAKTLLAIFALKLAEQGLLKLDQPITKFLHRARPDWLQKVSVRHLLSHRSGLFDYGAIKEYHEAVRNHPERAMEPEHFVSQVLAKGPQFEPGSSFFYSNVGYSFLREILEGVSKKSLQELFDDIVGAPLSIHMKLLEDPCDQMIEGYSPYLGVDALGVRSRYDFSWVYHGTFLASLTDLTALFSQLERILSSPSLEEMTNLHRLTFPHPEIHPSYGFGLMGDKQSKFGPVYGHNGGGPGFSVAVYVAPEKGATVAAIVNRDSSVEGEKLAFEILKLL